MPEDTKPELPEGMCEWVLLQKAQIDGAVRDAGYCFLRPEDWNPGGTTVRGDGPVGSAEEFKLDPLAIKKADLPKPAPSDGPALGENMPADIETSKHEEVSPDAEPEKELGPEPSSATPDPNAPHAA